MKPIGVKWSIVLIPLVVLSCNNKKIYSSSSIKQLEKEEYLEKLRTCEACILIDVRTPGEYNKSHLDNAVNISYLFGGFKRKTKKLDNTKTVFLYCETAHRSPLATKKLKKAGFKSIYDLKGGYSKLRN